MDTMLRFNHYMKLPAVKTKQKTRRAVFFSHQPPGKLRDSRMLVSERFTVLSTLCSSLSSRRKLILEISAHALNRKQ